MAMRPHSISFNGHVRSEDFRGIAGLLFDLLKQIGLPPVEKWQSAGERDGAPADLARAVAGLPDRAAGAGSGPHFIQVEFPGSMIGSIKFHPNQDGAAFCSINLQWIAAAQDRIKDFVAFQDHCLSLSRELLKRVDVHSAELRPEGGGLLCIPDVPLVDGSSHIVVTNREEVRDLYDDPEAFWTAGWSVVEEREGQRLLARDMDVVCGPEYLARIIGNQWTMARAAKPRETGYARPIILPEEEPIFKAGGARLEGVGYDPEEALLEYSCALNEGEHIRGWEIYTLLNIIEQGHLEDGSIVKTIRIVFMEQWAAEQEKRPLLDIGCRVYHYDADGELKELTE
jgi:hypothetical protein